MLKYLVLKYHYAYKLLPNSSARNKIFKVKNGIHI